MPPRMGTPATNAGDSVARVETGQAEVLEAELVGIASQAAWLDVASYLQSLPVLRSVDILEARPDTLRVRLDLAVDRARFEAMLAGSGRLVPEPSSSTTDAASPPPVRYRVAR